MLRKIFGADKKEVKGDWRKLRTEMLYGLYSAVNIILLMEKRKIMCVSHVARMGFRWGERSHLVKLDSEGSIILKCFLKK